MKKLTLIIMLLFSVYWMSTSLGQTKENVLSGDKVTMLEDRLGNIERSLEEILDNVSQGDYYSGDNIGSELFGVAGRALLIPIVGIVVPFVFVFAIVFVSVFMKNRDRKARYHLAEIALKAGKDIPDGLFVDPFKRSQAVKGIRNMCLGIGLGILFWFMTHESVLVCIGVLIFFTGLGQFLIHLYTVSYEEKKAFYNPSKSNKRYVKRENEDAVEFTAWEDYTDKDGNRE